MATSLIQPVSFFALEPLRLTASGALLIVVAKDGAASVLTAIEATGVPVAVIGEVRPSSEGITIVTNAAVEPLKPPVRNDRASLRRPLGGRHQQLRSEAELWIGRRIANFCCFLRVEVGSPD
jgi:hydrogenase maturation factor HypE